jgi:transcriptional regulator with XRE-family HTH domain
MQCLNMQTDESVFRPRSFQIRSARDLGAAVKYFRTRSGFSQSMLAERTGLHRSYLASLEGGHTTEALERLLTLLSELGVRVTAVQEE